MRLRAFLGIPIIAATIIALPAPSRAAPEFLAYEGRNAIHEGQGGEKKTVDGIDFWSNGDPPHRFKVLGSLTDRRHKTGLVGMVRMSGLDDDIAKAARAAGGDAVILQSEGDEVVGTAGFANGNVHGSSGYGGFHAYGSSSSFARPIEKHDSRYLVVKYLPDEEPAPPPAPPVGATAPVPAK
jgi:hypothetical protein